jgi:hypothetical protein
MGLAGFENFSEGGGTMTAMPDSALNGPGFNKPTFGQYIETTAF